MNAVIINGYHLKQFNVFSLLILKFYNKLLYMQNNSNEMATHSRYWQVSKTCSSK